MGRKESNKTNKTSQANYSYSNSDISDKQAPVFTTCPVEILTYDDKVVTWVAPVPEDNVGISQIVAEGDFYQDKKLRHGTYSISYTALDYDQNKAICAFNIYVYKSGTFYFYSGYAFPILSKQ